MPSDLGNPIQQKNTLAHKIGLISAILGIVGFGFFVHDRYIKPPENPVIDEDQLSRLAEILITRAAAKTDGGLADSQSKRNEQKGAIKDAIRGLSDSNNKNYKNAVKNLAEGNTEKAEDIYTKIAQEKEAELEKARNEAADAYRRLGSLAFLHDTNKALTAYRKATELNPEDFSGLTQLAILLTRVGKFQDALDIYNKTLSIAKKSGTQEQLAWATGNIGGIHRRLGEWDKATEYHQKSLDLHTKLGNNAGATAQLVNLGATAANKKEWDKAAVMFEKALEESKKLDNKTYISTISANLGGIYMMQRDLQKSEEMYLKALDINNSLNDEQRVASNYSNLGLLYKKKKQYQKSEEAYKKALEISTKLNWQLGIARSTHGLGNLLAANNSRESGCSNLRSALQTFTALKVQHKIKSVEYDLKANACR